MNFTLDAVVGVSALVNMLPNPMDVRDWLRTSAESTTGSTGPTVEVTEGIAVPGLLRISSKDFK
jgi:hypothetical protein